MSRALKNVLLELKAKPSQAKIAEEARSESMVRSFLLRHDSISYGSWAQRALLVGSKTTTIGVEENRSK